VHSKLRRDLGYGAVLDVMKLEQLSVACIKGPYGFCELLQARVVTE
jgi:hypothetical protein